MCGSRLRGILDALYTKSHYVTPTFVFLTPLKILGSSMQVIVRKLSPALFILYIIPSTCQISCVCLYNNDKKIRV